MEVIRALRSSLRRDGYKEFVDIIFNCMYNYYDRRGGDARLYDIYKDFTYLKYVYMYSDLKEYDYLYVKDEEGCNEFIKKYFHIIEVLRCLYEYESASYDFHVWISPYNFAFPTQLLNMFILIMGVELLKLNSHYKEKMRSFEKISKDDIEKIHRDILYKEYYIYTPYIIYEREEYM